MNVERCKTSDDFNSRDDVSSRYNALEGKVSYVARQSVAIWTNLGMKINETAYSKVLPVCRR